MKIGCPCGELIVDQTDDLPHKGHLVPDQEWYVNAEAVAEEAIGPAAEGRMGKQAASRLAQFILSRGKRLLWQCRACGRLYVEGLDEQVRCFIPEGDSVDREILRSRPAPAEPGRATDGAF